MGLSGCAGVALTTAMSTGPRDCSIAVAIVSISSALVTFAWKSSAAMPIS